MIVRRAAPKPKTANAASLQPAQLQAPAGHRERWTRPRAARHLPCRHGGTGSPIQRGRCCRGIVGLAHLACMAQLVVHEDEQEEDWSGWWDAAPARVASRAHVLARAWWACVEAHGEEDGPRLE